MPTLKSKLTKYCEQFTIECNNKTEIIKLKNSNLYDDTGCIYLFINKCKSTLLVYTVEKVNNIIKVHLNDINPIGDSDEYYNKGICTKALKILDLIANDLKAKCIYGEISQVDYGHINRLAHFYQKNKYNIICDDNNLPVKIVKNLP